MLPKVIEIAGRRKTNPNFLMAVMSFETGHTFSPSVKNRVSGATGLIQFMPCTAQGLGTSIAKLERMSAEEQLDYVEAHFKTVSPRGLFGTIRRTPRKQQERDHSTTETARCG